MTTDLTPAGTGFTAGPPGHAYPLSGLAPAQVVAHLAEYAAEIETDDQLIYEIDACGPTLVVTANAPDGNRRRYEFVPATVHPSTGERR